MTYYYMNEAEIKELRKLNNMYLNEILDRGFEDETGSSAGHCPQCEDETCEELESDWMEGSYLMGCTQCGKKYQWSRIITMEEVD